MGEELASLDAVAQAQLVRNGELSPLELVDAAIARIERWNPTLNAVVAPLFDEARAAARSPALPDGPFRGVPFLLKDIGAMQAGQPYWAGNRALRDAGYRAPRDCALGRRFRAAGLVTLGKTGIKTLDDLADLATDELVAKNGKFADLARSQFMVTPQPGLVREDTDEEEEDG